MRLPSCLASDCELVGVTVTVDVGVKVIVGEVVDDLDGEFVDDLDGCCGAMSSE